MIIIQARIPVHSDRRNLAYQRIHEFVDRVRTEDGCLHCEALITLDDPDCIVIHQTWRNVDDLGAHAAGPTLDAFLEALPEFVDGQVSTVRYEADAVDDDLPDDDVPADDDLQVAPQGITLH